MKYHRTFLIALLEKQMDGIAFPFSLGQGTRRLSVTLYLHGACKVLNYAVNKCMTGDGKNYIFENITHRKLK